MTESPSQALADSFVIVLNEPQDIVNIAGTLRVMMNTGLRQLRLVKPAIFDAYRLAGIAHGAEPLIEKVEFFDSLTDALQGTGRVVGTTSRRRTASFVWQHPREAAPELVALAPTLRAPVALVFGREDKGLANEELDLCERLLVIPTDPTYPSLNLAQAVLIVCYEVFLAAGDAAPLPRPKRQAPAATPAELDALFADTDRALDTIEFFKKRNSHMVMRSFRAILRRAGLNAREAKLLRAAAIEVRKFIERKVR